MVTTKIIFIVSGTACFFMKVYDFAEEVDEDEVESSKLLNVSNRYANQQPKLTHGKGNKK